MVQNILDHPNITVLLGEDYFRVKDNLKLDLTAYTGELDRFFDYKYRKLQYRSLDLCLTTEDQEMYQPVAVVNYPNDHSWTRITEYKHFLDEKSDKTTICFEYSKAYGESYYVMLTKDNLEKRRKYLEEVRALGDSFLFNYRQAQSDCTWVCV